MNSILRFKIKECNIYEFQALTSCPDHEITLDAFGKFTADNYEVDEDAGRSCYLHQEVNLADQRQKEGGGSKSNRKTENQGEIKKRSGSSGEREREKSVRSRAFICDLKDMEVEKGL